MSSATAVEQALALISAVHACPGKLVDEHPLVYGPAVAENVLALEEQGRVVSTCAVLARTFVVAGERLQVGLIGSVSTAPDERGHGHASRLLEQAEDELRRRGCALALLWAEDPRFYFVRGWRPIGAEDDYLLPPLVGPRLPRVASRLAEPGDVEALHRLASAHPTRVERSLDDMRRLLGFAGMCVRVAIEDGVVAAFTCCGRGRDLRGVVHEWGGEPRLVLGLLAEGLRELPHGIPGLFVMAPPDAHELRAALRAHDVLPLRGILGLAKILDRQAIADLLARRVAPGGCVTTKSGPDGALEVTLSGAQANGALTDDSLLTLLFSERGEREDIDALGRAFGFDASRLPLHPFAFGLDGI
jgi:GNAT superfamily N-acetyltransferase